MKGTVSKNKADCIEGAIAKVVLWPAGTHMRALCVKKEKDGETERQREGGTEILGTILG